MPGLNRGIPCGRAEPAPPGGPGPGERPCGENPGMTRGAVSSEGRTLCVRLARPYGCRGISFRPRGLTGAAGPMATSLGQPRATFAGVRSPPLQVGLARVKGLAGETRIWRERRFSRRGAVSAPAVRGHARTKRSHQVPRIGEKRSGRSRHAWLRPNAVLYGPAGPAPTGEGPMKRVSRGGRASPPGLRIRAPGK